MLRLTKLLRLLMYMCVVDTLICFMKLYIVCVCMCAHVFYMCVWFGVCTYVLCMCVYVCACVCVLCVLFIVCDVHVF